MEWRRPVFEVSCDVTCLSVTWQLSQLSRFANFGRERIKLAKWQHQCSGGYFGWFRYFKVFSGHVITVIIVKTWTPTYFKLKNLDYMVKPIVVGFFGLFQHFKVSWWYHVTAVTYVNIASLLNYEINILTAVKVRRWCRFLQIFFEFLEATKVVSKN